MSERDFFVEFPKATPGTGTTVLYSTRPYVSVSSGRPLAAGPVQSGERSQNYVTGWVLADQAATVHLQGWDVATGSWVNVDGAGTAVTAGTAVPLAYNLPGGDYQIVITFTVAPTTWKVPTSWRLTKGPTTNGQLVEVFEAVVDLTAAGTTILAPAVAGKQFVPSFVMLVGATVKSVGGTLTTAPNLTVGDSATFDNFITAAQGTGFPSATAFSDGVGTILRTLGGTIIIGHPGSAVVVNVASPATGTGLVYTAAITITGFYV